MSVKFTWERVNWGRVPWRLEAWRWNYRRLRDMDVGFNAQVLRWGQREGWGLQMTQQRRTIMPFSYWTQDIKGKSSLPPMMIILGTQISRVVRWHVCLFNYWWLIIPVDIFYSSLWFLHRAFSFSMLPILGLIMFLPSLEKGYLHVFMSLIT